MIYGLCRYIYIFMVDICLWYKYISILTMVYKPTYNWGAPPWSTMYPLGAKTLCLSKLAPQQPDDGSQGETSVVRWVKQCHLHHPPVITIFIGGVNHSQSWWFMALFFPHGQKNWGTRTWMGRPLDLSRKCCPESVPEVKTRKEVAKIWQEDCADLCECRHPNCLYTWMFPKISGTQKKHGFQY